jgi:membrane protein required for colicin V production
VDIVETIRSIQLVDLVIFLFLFAFFVLGFIQGTIRRALGLATVLFSFFLGIYAREPLGEFLEQYWTAVPPGYSAMIAFGTVFLASWIALTLIIQGFYHKTTLFERSTIVDEILGGILGVLEGVVLIGVMVVIFDSYYRTPAAADPDGLQLLRSIFLLYDPTATVAIYRDTILPAVFDLLGPLVPSELAALFVAPSP